MSYIFLSISFVFLVLCVEQAVKDPQSYPIVGRFAFISLCFNLLAMVLFPFSHGLSSTRQVNAEPAESHRVGNGVVEQSVAVASDTHRGGNGVEEAVDRAKATFESIDNNLNSMLDSTDRILWHLAEIKVALICPEALPLAPWLHESESPSPSPLLPDAGLDSGVGVSETPKED